ncbi:hypothetical protein BGT96224_5235 [Blumeria graminis f. sp. tritici 96224]|uniref:Pyroglutamyl-peptidase I n=2 Tax=Blumeria graminis f. sp. tritici TaxID=62690 RepID=A0A061HIF2_BLUGR|nr:hypothetical protein BGT96224_5235 [Blumeria graminis f. sp. tritici 96224]
MSSLNDTNSRDETIVLVTGFANQTSWNFPHLNLYFRIRHEAYITRCTQPFRVSNPINPAWEITRNLPCNYPLYGAQETSDHSSSTQSIIQIKAYPEPVKVAYKNVRDIVPRLWDDEKIDFVIHIGVAEERDYYSIERRAYRDGHIMPDVDGMLCADLTERHIKGVKWIWHDMPDEILSDVHIDDVCAKWKESLPVTLQLFIYYICLCTIDVRVSEDAGRYLCNFIYYSSLAQLTKNKKPKKVVFLHVPNKIDTASIEIGVTVTTQLIRAIAQMETDNKPNPTT